MFDDGIDEEFALGQVYSMTEQDYEDLLEWDAER